MKKLTYAIVAATMFALPVAALAAEFRAGEQPAVNSGERINNDLYIAGGSVTSAGAVTGDVFAGGGTVVISGSVGADLMVGGGNVTILSNVADDVRVGGGNVVIQGKVGGDVIAGGGQVTLGGPGVGGDVVVGGGSVRVDAPVGGSLKIGGGSVVINAPVKGDVIIEADTVTLGSGAVISGNITYKGKKEIVQEEGAVVQGTVDFQMRPERTSAKNAKSLVPVWMFSKFLMLLAGSLVVGLLLRRYSHEVVTKAVARPLLELGRGLMVFVVLPIVSMLLFMTFVGIPFGIIGLVGFVVSLMFAWIISPIILGSVVYKYFSKGALEVTWQTILLGAFIYSLLGIVPVIGWLIQAFLMLVSLGVMMAIKREVLQQWR